MCFGYAIVDETLRMRHCRIFWVKHIYGEARLELATIFDFFFSYEVGESALVILLLEKPSFRLEKGGFDFRSFLPRKALRGWWQIDRQSQLRQEHKDPETDPLFHDFLRRVRETSSNSPSSCRCLSRAASTNEEKIAREGTSPVVRSGCHCTARTKCSGEVPSRASMMPSSLQRATTRRPSPISAADWWWL